MPALTNWESPDDDADGVADAEYDDDAEDDGVAEYEDDGGGIANAEYDGGGDAGFGLRRNNGIARPPSIAGAQKKQAINH